MKTLSMKFYPLGLFLLLVSLLWLGGCKSKQYFSTGKTPEDFMVSLERTPCYGTCPVYKWEVNNTGTVIYEGRRFVDNIGKFTKTLSENDRAHLVEAMKNSSFFLYQDVYDNPGVTDLPSVSVTYRVNGEQKTVTVRGNEPETLAKLIEEIDAIVTPYNLEPYLTPEQIKAKEESEKLKN